MGRIDVDHALCCCTRSHFHKQLRCACHRAYGLRLVHAALKPARGLGVQTDAARCTANRRAVEGCRLKDDRARPLCDLRLEAAHNAREPRGFLAVGNDKLIPNSSTARIIQCVQVLTRMCTTCGETMPRNGVIVVCVERLSKFEHDEVRHIDHIVDGANPRPTQTICHPRGRRCNLYIAQYTCGKTAA